MKQNSMITVVCWAVLALSGLLADERKSQSPMPNKERATVLVKVNGRPITTADWQFFVETRKLADEDTSLHREDIIQRLVERQLLRAFLAEKKIAADPKLVDEYITRLRLRAKERDKDFDVGLKKSGFTEESLRRELSLPLDWEAFSKTQITDAKLRAAWDQRRGEFDGSEVRAAHIALKSDNPDADERFLKQLRTKIVAGEISFADAARKHSQAPSAEVGGDLLRSAFRGKQPLVYSQHAFALKVGEVSEPFRCQFGVQLMTVLERIDGQLSLEDARRDIFLQLSTELQRDTLRQLQAKATIERIESAR